MRGGYDPEKRERERGRGNSAEIRMYARKEYHGREMCVEN